MIRTKSVFFKKIFFYTERDPKTRTVNYCLTRQHKNDTIIIYNTCSQHYNIWNYDDNNGKI